jgi:iron complex transport system ATP-binding protein
MSATQLYLDQISLDRDGQRVLHGISANAPVGQLTAILGPNGAGKSSLLAVIAGELAPATGKCEFAGLSVHATQPQQLARRRAMLPQLSALEFDFRVRDVALLGASPFPEIASDELDKLCESVLQLCDIMALADRRYPSLSGGEKQRVQLARVLVQACAAATLGPALMLLDEPTASLDPRHQHLLLAGLRQLCRNIPLAVIASLHDVNLAMRYADVIWLLDRGKLVTAGPPAAALSTEILSSTFQLPARNINGYIIFELPTSA